MCITINFVISITGLEIDPCIPAAWDGFSAVRQFRSTCYHIQVRNPGHVNRGVQRVRVDGRAIAGSILPLFSDGQQHHVDVILG